MEPMKDLQLIDYMFDLKYVIQRVFIVLELYTLQVLYVKGLSEPIK